MPTLVHRRTKKDGRGRTRRIVTYESLDDDRKFDIPYEPFYHRQLVLHEIRLLTQRGRGPRNKKYERKQALRWKSAILRKARLLEGFFADETGYRDKVMRWCDKVLAKASV